jgi:hypothetical protein
MHDCIFNHLSLTPWRLLFSLGVVPKTNSQAALFTNPTSLQEYSLYLTSRDIRI